MRWAQAIVALLVAIALVPHFFARSAFERSSPLVVLLGAAAALTMLQLIPLPPSVLERLNATGQGLREDGAQLLDLAPWSAITLDAPATLRALGFFFLLLGIAVVCLRIATTERGRYRLVAAVTVVCALAAVVTVAHKILGLQMLYGVYDPRATPAIIGPLLNENHLGGLMAIGATSAAGLVMYRRQRSWLRVTWLIVVGLCGVVTMLSQSRGATLALLAGMFVTAALLLGQRFAGSEAARRRRGSFITSSLPIGVVAASAIVIVVYSSAGGTQQEFDKTSLREVDAPTSKFAAWKSSSKLVEEAPWFGVGRGAMETSFTRVHASSGFVTFSHLENEYLQTPVDYGIAGTIILGAFTLWLSAVAIRRWKDGAIAAGALGGITCALLQSSVDFGVELLGLAMPLTVLVATVAYVPMREASRSVMLRGRTMRAGLVVVLCAVAATMFSDATKSVDEDHHALSSERASVALAEILPAISRHPLDYYGYALAADVLSRSGDNRAIRLLNHALRLHPTHPGLHRVAARMLLRSGHDEQATLEYAMALRYSQDPSKLLAEIVQVFPRDRAIAAIPSDLSDVYVVSRALRDLKKPDLAGMWLSRVVASRRSAAACDLWFDVMLEGIDLPLDSAHRCLEALPDRQTRLALARVLINKERYSESVRLLQDVETWPGRIDERAAAWLTLCDVHTVMRAYADAKRCLRRLDASGDLSTEQGPAVQARLAQIEKDRRDEDLARDQIRKLFLLD
jgi:O-Antigen ligase